MQELLPNECEQTGTCTAVPSSIPPTKSPCPSTSASRSDLDVSSDSSSQSVKTTFKEGVPVNYALPKCFSASVMQSLDNKKMMPNTRSAFVRELVVHMTSFGIRPTRNFCSTVARRIILKYPFLRDAVGNGYVSM